MNPGQPEAAPSADGFRPEEAFACELDAEDALATFRGRFRFPRCESGAPPLYFAGNSLGLQPEGASELVQRTLADWAELAVDAHFDAAAPWYAYHELLRAPMARLVGARPDEVVMMNGLTVNLHLMMVSFYRPTRARYKILIEDCAFPSDLYAVKTQLAYHGYDPEEGLIVARSPSGRPTATTAEIEALLERHGSEIALVLLGGVNYYTGQRFEIERIAELARRHGCAVGFDLAHAAGNVELALHDWQVDFAVWCSYKYLNGGPGSVAGCFVHQRHLQRDDIPRFGGWWGNDPQTRFRMHLESSFRPVPSADGWQLSNPPILAMAPLRASLALFDQATMPALRAKSVKLTAYLAYCIERSGGPGIEVITPGEPQARGCQLSLRVVRRSRELFESLKRAGVVADYREPDVIRVAPVPLYNSFHDVWRFGRLLEAWADR